MTTWVTFETIAESAQKSEFAVRTIYVDRLGCHQFHKDERVRFEFRYLQGDAWIVEDYETEDSDTQQTICSGTMLDCVRFMAARVLYGA